MEHSQYQSMLCLTVKFYLWHKDLGQFLSFIELGGIQNMTEFEHLSQAKSTQEQTLGTSRTKTGRGQVERVTMMRGW